MKRNLLLLGWLALIAACGGRQEEAPGPVTMDAAAQEAWEIDLVEARIEKNEAFMDARQSPLPDSLLTGFEGLDYYFPVKELRYRLALEPAPAETVPLAKAKGNSMDYVRAGRVRFRHDDQVYSLTVFSPAAGGDELFVPFYDATNGETTYPGGRYLDLERAAGDTVELDFNRAYNPYCAYDHEHFNCTLPPDENRLPFAVEAGEKLFAGDD